MTRGWCTADMSRFYDLVSQPAREMAGYTPNPPAHLTSLETRPRFIRLDSNENPFGPSPRAVEAMQAALSCSNVYPDDDSRELRTRLAASHQLSDEQVMVTAGSTAMLSLLCQTLLQPGLNAVTSEKSFIVYSMAVQGAGAQLIEAPMREDSFDLDAVLNAVDENTRIVFLANPNNPTGTMLDAVTVESFLASVPGHVVVVLDEAYYEFAAHFASMRRVEYSRSLQCVQQGANVVVLRTFSKAHGLAGLRVGYGLGPAELLGYCARMRNTFSVSSVAQTAALAALDDHAHVERVIANNAEQARFLTEGLARFGFRVVPTSANFIYCDLGQDDANFAARLRGEGVSVRPLRVWGAPNCIRVSIGTPEQNQILLHTLRKISGQNSSQRVALP
jgi:histidinol-phosphate aminotransferase